MPLSEQEQRLLEEMERNLYQNDADFVATVSGPRGRPNYTQIVLGSLLAIAGVGALVAGVIVQYPIVGVVGFALMLGGVLLVLAPGKGSSAAAPTSTSRNTTAKPARRSSFMDTINERWERRSEGGQGR
jgi:predicted phage tail protein